MGFSIYQVFPHICTNVFRFAVWITATLVVVGAGVVVVFSPMHDFPDVLVTFEPQAAQKIFPDNKYLPLVLYGCFFIFLTFSYAR